MKKLHRLLILLCTLLVVLVVIFFNIWLHQPGVLPIKQVKIAGSYQFVGNKAIKKALLPFVTKGFFSIPIGNAQRALEALPGVKVAIIRRVWPSTILIRLTEESVVGTWGNDALLSKSAQVFVPEKTQAWKNLPAFLGKKSKAKQILRHFLLYQTILEKDHLKIMAINYADSDSWSLETNKQFWLYLGDNHMTLRLQRFALAYPYLIADQPTKQLSYVDLRYQHGFSVKWINPG